MRIDTNGNVGIGTNSAATTLTVAGGLATKGPVTVSASTYTVAATEKGASLSHNERDGLMRRVIDEPGLSGPS